MIEQSGSGGWGTTPIGHWTMKRTAAAVGIVVHLGMGMGMGPAWAQNATTSPASNGGTSLPGVPVTPVSHVADSVGGVTQATSANKAMNCAAGTVLSGGACVSLPTPTPPPNCAYGTVWTGGTCAPIGNFTPPSVNCPSGQVLSGGSCVPLSSNPATCPTTTPASTQSLSCPSGQTGSISQTRTVQCDASTGYAWSTGTWSTSSNSCVTPAPPANTPCVAIYQTWGSACYGYTPGISAGSQTTVANASATLSGSATYSCNNGTWTYISGSCSSGSQPAPAPPTSTPCIASNQAWGSACYGYITGASSGSQASVTNTNSTLSGSATYSCNNGTWSYISGSCSQTPQPCTAQNVSWSSCWGTAPTANNGGYSAVTNSAGGFTGTGNFSCSNGSWVYSSGSCNANSPPPPAQCQAYYGLAWTWGSSNQCSGTVNVGATASGQSYTVYSSSGGYYTFNCNAGTWQPGGEACSNSRPPPAVGCASIPGYRYNSGGAYAYYPLPATASGQSVYVDTGMYFYSGGMSETFCPNPGSYSCNQGNWSYPSSCYNGSAM